MTDVAELVPDIDTLAQRLDAVDYLADQGMATALFCAVRLPQPLLLEGEAGVGKTEAAKALAAVLDTPLIRLQCYEGIKRSRSALRVELSPSTVADPIGRVVRRGPGGGRVVRPGVPRRSTAPTGDRASRAAARGPADRRDRPSRRRIRGVPLRTARRVVRHDPRARHDPGHRAPGRRADLEPDPRPARRTEAPLPLPLDRLSAVGTGGGDCPPTGADEHGRAAEQVARAVARLRTLDVQSHPASPRRSTGRSPSTCSVCPHSTPAPPMQRSDPSSSTGRTSISPVSAASHGSLATDYERRTTTTIV